MLTNATFLTPAPKLNRYAESRADYLVSERKMLAVDKTAAYQKCQSN
jgi:hypothetical protein